MTPFFPTPGRWTLQAACSLSDYERLDPIVGGSPTSRELEVRVTAARELCAVCPVVLECGAEADSWGDPGVRGGSLRYVVADPEHPLSGHYIARPLIREAAPSPYDAREQARRLRGQAEPARSSELIR